MYWRSLMYWIDSLSRADLDLSLLFLFWSCVSVFYRNIGANFCSDSRSQHCVSVHARLHPSELFNSRTSMCIQFHERKNDTPIHTCHLQTITTEKCCSWYKTGKFVMMLHCDCKWFNKSFPMLIVSIYKQMCHHLKLPQQTNYWS